ncbi:MAG: type II secretion system protein M [Rubrivivax sp.]|nr:type II secretion system protein M [Rubrivivax sp.]MBK7263841.1 type II secretion system protein M [Rubrivivax sp.]MBK8525879.1 type II secretion system protein M [Rubrivivax sp.]
MSRSLLLPEPLQQRLQALRAAWAQRDARERRLVVLAAWVLGLFVLWSLAVQPAWRSLRDAPARIDGLDAQSQAMQLLAADVRELRATPPLPRTQASAALRAASERLGAQGRLTEQGERAVLALTDASGEQLRAWLAEVRAGARARPIEANLTRSDRGLSGTVVVGLGGS